jgi:glycosyltransferase involved in cell wall biosynthesis
MESKFVGVGSNNMSNKSAVHLLMTDYKIDSRVRNETNSLAGFGYEVLVCCLSGEGQPKIERREQVDIHRFGSGRSRLPQYITAYISMFIYLLRKKIDIVHAHDLTALPIAVLISKFKRIPLVYDSHELWSQSHHGDHPSWAIKVMEVFEKLFGGQSDAVITVSDGISRYLKNYLNVATVSTIRNIPSYTQRGIYDLFRGELSIAKTTPIFLYQGLISQSRGVDVFFQAALNICEKNNVAFVFMGSGPYAEVLRQKITESSMQNIFYKDAVSQNELLKYTNSADIGVHAIKNSCLNHDLCLPNKLFEYMSAGIPVLVSELTEMSSFVKQYGIGMCFENNSVNDLSEKIQYLLDNPKVLADFKEHSMKAAKNITWEAEALVLKKLYSDLFAR